MSERSANPLDTLATLFVYVPLGFLLDARELVPQLATRGRQQVELLKVGAKFMVAKSKLDADQKLRRSKAASAPAPPPAAPPAAAAPPAPKARRRPSRPPIASYDTLSATQILPRLATLSAHDLAVVEDYERSHRGRRTILGRIDQLRAAAV